MRHCSVELPNARVACHACVGHRSTFSDSGIGGGERDRTDDPLLAKQVLSQLSYTPDEAQTTFALRETWWVWMDSNHRPPPYQDDALTN